MRNGFSLNPAGGRVVLSPNLQQRELERAAHACRVPSGICRAVTVGGRQLALVPDLKTDNSGRDASDRIPFILFTYNRFVACLVFMSRFVSGGTADEPVQRDDAWIKAQQEIEAKRREKEEQNQQGGGKSLYETLEANKAAKQEAFEEASRLRNQFRALHDDEVEFLDSVLESTRAKEAAVRKETLNQLNEFRQQQELKEKAELGKETEDQPQEQETWAVGGKKRKRAKGAPAIAGVKLRKSSSAADTATRAEDVHTRTPDPQGKGNGEVWPAAVKPAETKLLTVDAKGTAETASAPEQQTVTHISPAITSGLGLGGYSSEED